MNLQHIHWNYTYIIAISTKCLPMLLNEAHTFCIYPMICSPASGTKRIPSFDSKLTERHYYKVNILEYNMNGIYVWHVKYENAKRISFDLKLRFEEGEANCWRTNKQTNALSLQTNISIKIYRTQKYLHESKPR